AGVAPESIILANARRVVGWSLAAQEKWSETLAAFEAMRAGVDNDPNLAQRFGNGDTQWGYALVRAGKVDDAAVMLKRVYEHWRALSGDKDYRTIVARGYYAVALAAKGEKDVALNEFAQSVPAL